MPTQQLLGSNQSKTAGTSLVISPSSKTVTVGNVIFVAFASDDVGSGFGITDNLGNTYSQVGSTQVLAGAVKTQLWRAPVTTGGSITTITISWTTNITAKAGVAGEFDTVGTLRLTDGGAATDTATTITTIGTPIAFFTGELWIGAVGVEDDVGWASYTVTGTPSDTMVELGKNGTTGGGSATNITCGLAYVRRTANSSVGSYAFATNSGSTQDCAGVGAIYNAAVTYVDGGEYLHPTNQPSGHYRPDWRTI